MSYDLLGIKGDVGMEYNINLAGLVDDSLIEDLKSMPQSSRILEVDIGYIRSEHKRGLIIIDEENGVLVAFENIDSYSDEYALVYGKLMAYIFIYGRPKKVRIKNNYIGNFISRLCKIIDVETVIGNSLINIDRFLIQAI